MEKLRTAFWWFGGKGNMIAKLLEIVPQGGKPYCEPYCGAASLFFAREPAPVEVLNDLDGDIVNFFRVLQNRSSFEELRHRLMYTPFARDEFGRAIEILNTGGADEVTRAWAFFVRQNQGFAGMQSRSIGNWARSFTSACGVANNVNKWIMHLCKLDAFRWRLMHAQIDCRDALEVIEYWDGEDTVFYIDPPYHPETRKSGRYLCEANDEHHKKLIEILLQVKGAVILSGYNHPVYWALEKAGWEKIDYQTICHAAVKTRSSGLRGKGKAMEKVPRVESIWLNAKAQEYGNARRRDF